MEFQRFSRRLPFEIIQSFACFSRKSQGASGVATTVPPGGPTIQLLPKIE